MVKCLKFCGSYMNIPDQAREALYNRELICRMAYSWNDKLLITFNMLWGPVLLGQHWLLSFCKAFVTIRETKYCRTKAFSSVSDCLTLHTQQKDILKKNKLTSCEGKCKSIAHHLNVLNG